MKLEMSEFLKLASEEQLQTRGRRRYRKGKKGRRNFRRIQEGERGGR